MHLVILDHIQQQADQPKSKLKSDIALWKEKFDDQNTTELIRAILATVICVGTKLQQDRAILLPQAVKIFLDNYPHQNTEELYLEDR